MAFQVIPLFIIYLLNLYWREVSWRVAFGVQWHFCVQSSSEALMAA